VRHADKDWLVTAGHNLTGRNAETGELLSEKTGATPDAVTLRLTWMGTLGQWTEITEPLYDSDEQPLWLAHPTGRRVDVAALSLTQLHPPTTTIYPWDLAVPPLAELTVPDDLSIVGYPFCLTSGEGFPIWSRGTIATELDFDHDGLPMFLVDSRTRQGQSGAPVLWYSSHGMIPVKGGWKLNDGKQPPLSFMGIYAGRISGDSDLGRVFKISAIAEVLEHGVRPTAKR
jgi:hypothetical protein